jgi:hypothetical protein
MNKAFTREPEPAEPRCPAPAGCGALGIPVGRKTLLAQLPDDLARAFGETAYYCPTPGCPVGYFDGWGAQAPASALRRPSYPKSPTSPVCPCFGITARAIREEAEAGRKDLVRDLVARAASEEARCETEAPCGTSCVVEARKIFLKHFPSGEP